MENIVRTLTWKLVQHQKFKRSKKPRSKPKLRKRLMKLSRSEWLECENRCFQNISIGFFINFILNHLGKNLQKRNQRVEKTFGKNSKLLRQKIMKKLRFDMASQIYMACWSGWLQSRKRKKLTIKMTRTNWGIFEDYIKFWWHRSFLTNF